MSSQPQKFLFHRHLTLMQCRKDIIFQNDFINQKIKNKNTSIFFKYSKKIKENKMRLTYLAGFCAFFSLGPIYDFIFQSLTYHRVSSYVFDRAYLPALKQLEERPVDYKVRQAKELGQYFMKIQQKHPDQEIKASMFAFRVPEFVQEGDQPLDVNTFVTKCMNKGVKIEDLPFI